MTTVDLRTEAKQILDGLSEESLTVAFGLLKALQNQKPQKRTALLAESEIDWLDTEYMEQARQEVKEAISLEEARAILAKIPGSLSDTIIAEREERF